MLLKSNEQRAGVSKKKSPAHMYCKGGRLYNPNVPLRNLFYIANLLQKLISKRDLYGSRLIKIPTPRFAVFYNGTEQRSEVEELRLSTAFENPMDEPEIELVCKVYNINQGKNVDLLEHCNVLKEYMFFVDRVRYYVKELGDEQENLEIAIERAIDDCIKNHILEDFLKSRRGEVVKVVQLDYTWERREELIRKEQYEEGLEDGRNTVFDILQKLKQGATLKELVDHGFDEEVVKRAQMLL